MARFFTPPTRGQLVPRVNGDTPENQRKPAIYFKPEVLIGVNVWWYTNNTISEQQPPLWEPRTNADGSITPGVRKVWYGGHGPYPITDGEYQMLLGAGYSANLT